MYEISKNIPIPEARKAYNFPIGSMDVGDSFEVPPGEKIAAHNHARYCEKKYEGKKFTIRKMPNGNYRVWRIS